MKGRAQIGNDSPFAAAYPSTDPSVPQREQNIAAGQATDGGGRHGQGLQGDADHRDAIWKSPNTPQLIQNAVKEIGVDLELNILDQGAYYGDAVFGKSNWLDSDMGITDYGHRGVPNVFLAAPLTERRHLERGAFQERGLRHAGDQLHRGARPRSAEGDGRQDPEAAARRDAGHLRLFLRLPDSDHEGRRPACSRPPCRSCSSSRASKA